MIAANRALLLALIATNFFGQNTPAIMATEAHYMEMWAQDAAAMYGYQATAQAASVLSPFTVPAPTTSPAGLAGQAAAVVQAISTAAGSGAQTVGPFATAMSTPLTSVVTPDALAELASIASSMSSSSSATPISLLTTVTSSGISLTSGAGSATSLSASGLSAIGSVGPLVGSLGPRSVVLANQIRMLGLTLGDGPGSGIFGTAPGSAQVTAGVGRAASLGTLSVPQSWAAAAPAFSHVGSALPGAGGGASPAVSPGEPAGMLNGMPMLPKATRGSGAPIAYTPRFGFRPTIVEPPVYAG